MTDENTPLLQEQQENRRLSVVQDGTALSKTVSPTHWLAPEPAAEAEENVPPTIVATPKDVPYLIDVTPARFWIMYAPMLCVYFVATFDGTLMASSHPVITSYFHSSNSASWLSTAFMLTSSTSQPLYGRFSDIFGRRPLYIFSLVVFGATTAWCGLANSMSSFIAARAICGMGAGGVVGMASIITNDLVRIERRGAYQSYINIFYGLGSSCGAAFGGFLCDTVGWRWAFGIQVPLVALILIMAFLTVPEGLGPNLAKTSDQKWHEALRDFDLAGSLCLTLTTACLILGLNLGGNVLPWRHPLIIASLILFVVAAITLVFVERRATRPIMPLALLGSFPKANLIFSNFFSQIGTLGVIFNAPLYFQAVKLDTASTSGFRLVAPSLLLTVCAVFTGFFINRTGRLKSPQVLGAVLMLIGGVCLTTIWDGIPTWLVTLFVAPPSAGQGFMFPTTTMALLAVSTRNDQAVVTAALGVFRSIGSVLGVAISSLILQNALLGYLDQFVTGPNKMEIIQNVRKEVRAILDLDSMHQTQVINAYREALRWAFVSSIVSFSIVNLLVLPLKLPRLGRDKVKADTNTEE